MKPSNDSRACYVFICFHPWRKIKWKLPQDAFPPFLSFALRQIVSFTKFNMNGSLNWANFFIVTWSHVELKINESTFWFRTWEYCWVRSSYHCLQTQYNHLIKMFIFLKYFQIQETFHVNGKEKLQNLCNRAVIQPQQYTHLWRKKQSKVFGVV